MLFDVFYDGKTGEDILFEDKVISTCDIAGWSGEFV